MKRLVVVASTVLTVLLSFSTQASAITLDFNALTPGIISETDLSNAFAGVSFNNTGGSNFEVRSSSPGFPFTGNSILNSPFTTSGNSTIATFDSLVNSVSVTMGDFNADPDTLFLFAYNSSNVIVDSTNLGISAASSIGHTLTVNASGIKSVEFYGVGVSNNSVFWDNFAWDEEGGPVQTDPPDRGDNPIIPEPSSMFLLGSGMLAAFVRRKIF